jgi:hypothetical protein
MEFEILEVKREEQKVGEGELIAEGGLESLGLGFREVEERNWRDDISPLSSLDSRCENGREG